MKRGHVQIRVRQYADGRWGFDDYSRGQLKKVRLKSKAKADARAQDVAVLLANGRRDLLEIDPKELAQFREWSGARKKSRSVAELRASLIARLESENDLNPGWIDKLKIYISPLESEFGERAVAELRAPALADLLASLKKQPRNRNNYRAAWVQLFRYARAAGDLPDGVTTEAEKIKRLKIKYAEKIALWTPEEMIHILGTSPARYLPWPLISGFAGVRTEELMPDDPKKSPLDKADFDWDEAVIRMRGETAKTGKSRIIPIPDNLRAWLEPYRAETSGPWIRDYPKIQNVVAAMTTATGLKHRKNAFRHSYATYTAAIEKDLHNLAEKMGTSVDRLRFNYKRPALEKLGRQWMSILPERPANVRSIGFRKVPKSSNLRTPSTAISRPR